MAGEEGINPELMRRFRALQAEAARNGHVIGIGSGFRTMQQQIDLRIANGCPDIWTAPARDCDTPTAIPGSSNHEHGFAIDYSGNDEADAWVAANAGNFGLGLPVEGEIWHLEMLDDEGSHDAMTAAQNVGAIGFNVNWMEEANPQDELANRIHSIMRTVGMGGTTTQLPQDLIGLEGIETADPNMPEASQGQSAIPDMKASQLPPGTLERTGGGDLREYALQRLRERGLPESEINALTELWNRESGDPNAGGGVATWNPNAQNPRSTAYGIAQFLDGTWAGVGGEKTSDPYKQIDYGIEYIIGRFNTPSEALAFHDRNNWY